MSATADAPAHFRRGATRPGPVGLLGEALVEVTQRRRLIRYLVQADIRKKGADTILGNLWWVLDPLLQMAVYVVLVSVVFNRGGPDYPLFIFAAILPWKWFQSTVYDATTSVTGADRLIRQIQFPKLVLPVASAFAGVVNFAFGLVPLVALILLLYRDRLSLTLLFIPAIALVQLFFNLAIAVGLAALNVFYRDIGNLSRTPSDSGSTSRPGSMRSRICARPPSTSRSSASCCWPTRSRSCSRPTAMSSTASGCRTGSAWRPSSAPRSWCSL